MNCINCGAILSCSCQQRTASNGKSCCTVCVAGLELEINRERENQQSPLDTVNTPIITEITHRHTKP